MTQQRHWRGRHRVFHHHPLNSCLHEWELHQCRPGRRDRLSAYLTAFTPNMLLTCRRAGNPLQSPVCLSGTRGLVFAWGPCCSPRRATRLVCPSCMLVNGTRWCAHKGSLTFTLPLPPSHKHGLPESSVCDVTRSIQEAGGWWGGW